MHLPTANLLLVFAMAALAVDPPSIQTINMEDSLDFVDASFVARGVTQATIITATPTNERLSNYSTTVSSTTDISTTASSIIITTTVPSATVPTSTVPTTTIPTTTIPTTTTAQPSEEEAFFVLLAENTVALSKSEFLANTLKTETSNISSDLDKKVTSLVLIDDIEKLLLNVTRSLAVSEADLLQSFVNSIYKVDYIGNRTINILSYLLKFRELYRDRVKNFSCKLNGMQDQILRSSKGLDNKLKLVNQILKQYIEPRVINLKDSLANINISQVNSEAELQNLPEVQNLTATSIIKLTSLTKQLVILNHTLDRSLYFLGEAVNGLELANPKTIIDLLHSVSISQKRIDLGITVCENRPSEYIPKSYETYLENYSNDYVSNGSEEIIGSKRNSYEELSKQTRNIN